MGRIYNLMDNLADKCKEEGREEGKAEAHDECCLSLLKEGTLPEEKIATLLKMSLSRVMELKKTIQA